MSTTDDHSHNVATNYHDTSFDFPPPLITASDDSDSDDDNLGWMRSALVSASDDSDSDDDEALRNDVIIFNRVGSGISTFTRVFKDVIGIRLSVCRRNSVYCPAQQFITAVTAATDLPKDLSRMVCGYLLIVSNANHEGKHTCSANFLDVDVVKHPLEKNTARDSLASGVHFNAFSLHAHDDGKSPVDDEHTIPNTEGFDEKDEEYTIHVVDNPEAFDEKDNNFIKTCFREAINGSSSTLFPPGHPPLLGRGVYIVGHTRTGKSNYINALKDVTHMRKGKKKALKKKNMRTKKGEKKALKKKNMRTKTRTKTRTRTTTNRWK
jgi:hypothetical protein